jgi:hypothetical protein
VSLRQAERSPTPADDDFLGEEATHALGEVIRVPTTAGDEAGDPAPQALAVAASTRQDSLR